MKFKHIGITTIIGVIFAAIAAYLLQTHSADVMSVIEGHNTFLNTSVYFDNCMSNPAGLLTWCGAYLTQFMADATGIYILCALWIGVIVLTAFVMRLETKWAALATIPAAMLLASNVGLEYWIFYLDTPGYLFTATIGVLVALAGGWIVNKLSKWGIGAILALALYPLFGIYGLLANILGVIFICMDKDLDKKHKWINLAVAFIALIMPIIWCSTVYHTSQLSAAYTAGLQDFKLIDKADNEQYVPYILLFLSLIILTAVSNYLDRCKKAIVWIAASVLLIVAEVAYVDHRWYNDENYECELRMLKCIENGEWQNVIYTDNEYSCEPTRAIVMMRDLALFKLGRLGNQSFTFRNGGKMPESAISVSLAHTIAPIIYYHYGKINYCNRWHVEHNVDHGWSADSYRYMIKCAAINGEKELAAKYAGLLKTTRNYKDSEEVKIGLGLVSETDDMKAAKSLMTYDDFLGSDRDLPELYLLDNFANDTISNKSIKTLAIHSLLVQKDLRLFWPHFFHFAELLSENEAMPIHFQEAAYLLGKSKESQVNVDGMPFDQQVKDTYMAFAAQMAQYNHLNKAAKRQVMNSRFGKTYFYYYYLGEDFNTY